MIKNLELLQDRLSGITLEGQEIDSSKLIEIINDEKEHELSADDVTILTDTDLDDLKTRLGKDSYNDGVVAGEEMATKKIKKHLGVEVEGRDFDKIASTIKENLQKEAKQPIDKKVEQLNESLSALQKTYEAEKGQWEAEKSDIQSRFVQQKKDAFLSQNLPDISGMKKNHLLALVKADGIDVDFNEDGEAVALRQGKPVLDKLQKSVNFEAVINDWVAENGFAKGSPGRKPEEVKPIGTFESEHDVYKYAEREGIDPTSPEFDKLLEQVSA